MQSIPTYSGLDQLTLEELKSKIKEIQKKFSENEDFLFSMIIKKYKNTIFKEDIDKIININLLTNYYKFLLFCQENILKKFNSNKQYFIENPITLHKYDDNLDKQDHDYMEAQQKYYQHIIPSFYFNKYKKINAEIKETSGKLKTLNSQKTSGRYILLFKRITETKNNLEKKMKISKKKKKVFNENEEKQLCDLKFQQNSKPIFKKVEDLWTYNDLLDIDNNQNDICYDGNHFYDELKYNGETNNIDIDYDEPNMKALLFYFDRFKDLLSFMKAFIEDTEHKINFSESEWTYIKDINCYEFYSNFGDIYGQTFFSNKKIIEYFIIEYIRSYRILKEFVKKLKKLKSEELEKFKVKLREQQKQKLEELLNFKFSKLIINQEKKDKEDLIKKLEKKHINIVNIDGSIFQFEEILPFNFDSSSESEERRENNSNLSVNLKYLLELIIKTIAKNIHYGFYDKLSLDLKDKENSDGTKTENSNFKKYREYFELDFLYKKIETKLTKELTAEQQKDKTLKKRLEERLKKIKEDLKKNSLEISLLKTFLDNENFFGKDVNGNDTLTDVFKNDYSEFIELYKKQTPVTYTNNVLNTLFLRNLFNNGNSLLPLYIIFFFYKKK